MTLGALVLVLVAVGAMAFVTVRTRRLVRESSAPARGEEPPEIELPADVEALLEAGEEEQAVHLLARRLAIGPDDARALVRAAR